MKRITGCLLITLVAAFTYANDLNTKLSPEPTAEQKHQMAVYFLKGYDNDFTIVNWKIRVKHNKVVMKKYRSLEKLVLFNHYFIKQLDKKQNQTNDN